MKQNIIRILGILCILSMCVTSASAATITPTKENVTKVMQNYNLNNQNNSLQLACEIGQFVSTEYGWNCDIRQLNFTSHAPIYINVFYPAADNKKGYEAYYGWFGPQRKEVTGFTGKDKKMYYTDWNGKGNECYISGVKGYGIVQSYFGNVIEVNGTDPVAVPEENNTTASEDTYNNTSVTYNNGNINNTVVDSKNTVNNQGWIGNVTQYFMDFSNTDWSNVTFNFLGQ